MNDNIEQRLQEIRELRREGSISAEEAYRRHEEIVAQMPRAAAPPPPTSAPPPAPSAAYVAPEANKFNADVFWTIVIGVVAIVAAVAAVLAVTNALSKSSSPESAPDASSAQAQPTLVPLPTATARAAASNSPRPTATATGGGSSDCRVTPAAGDTLEVISVDPPVGGIAPDRSVTVTVRYSLASRDAARIALITSSDTSSGVLGPISGAISVTRGVGQVTFTRLTTGGWSPGTTFNVYLLPTGASLAPCSQALFVLPLPYTQ